MPTSTRRPLTIVTNPDEVEGRRPIITHTYRLTSLPTYQDPQTQRLEELRRATRTTRNILAPNAGTVLIKGYNKIQAFPERSGTIEFAFYE